MGGVQSSKGPRTPLAVMLKYFDKGFCGDYGRNVPLDPEELKELCEIYWPKLESRWPAQGSTDPEIIAAVLEKVGSDMSQFPYIHSWQCLVAHNKKWIARCKKQATPPKKEEKKRLAKVFSLSASKRVDYKNRSIGSRGNVPMDYKPQPDSFEAEEEWLAPPPYCLPRSRAQQQQQQQQQQPDRRQPAAPSAPAPAQAAPTAAPREQVRQRAPAPPPPPSSSSSSPTSPTSSTSEETSYVVEMPSDPEEGPPEHNYSRRTYDLRDRSAPVTTAPLREVIHMIPQEDGPATRVSAFQYLPFTSSDLVAWKSQNLPYSEAPQQLTDLCESIMCSHNPTWQDCEQLLLTLFTREERTRVKEAAIKLLKGRVPIGMVEEVWVAESCPSANPNWDPNVPADMNRIRAYQTILIDGMRAAMKKPVNLAVPNEVRQKPDESPDHFYERLLDAYVRFTPLDIGDPNNQRLINMAFVTQSCGDIRRKLQKREGFPAYPISLLLELARKVFEGREEEIKKEQERKVHKKAQLLAAALTGEPTRTLASQGSGNPPMNSVTAPAVPVIAYQATPAPVQPVAPAPLQLQVPSYQPAAPQYQAAPPQQYLAPQRHQGPPQQYRQWSNSHQNQIQKNQCRRCGKFGHWGSSCHQGAPQHQRQYQNHQNSQFYSRGRNSDSRGGQVQNDVYYPPRDQPQGMPQQQGSYSPTQPQFQPQVTAQLQPQVTAQFQPQVTAQLQPQFAHAPATQLYQQAQPQLVQPILQTQVTAQPPYALLPVQQYAQPAVPTQVQVAPPVIQQSQPLAKAEPTQDSELAQFCGLAGTEEWDD